MSNRGTERGEQKGCSNYDDDNITTSTYNLSVLRLFHVTVCNKNQLLAIPPHPSHQARIIFNQEGQGIYRRCLSSSCAGAQITGVCCVLVCSKLCNTNPHRCKLFHLHRTCVHCCGCHFENMMMEHSWTVHGTQ